MSPRSNKLYRLLFENSLDMIWILEDLLFIDVNPAAVSALGYDGAEDLMGRSVLSISPETQPDGTPSSDRAEQLISAVVETGSISFDWLLLKKDGSPLLCQITLTAQEIDDKSVVLAIGRDITEQKRTEEELREQKQAAVTSAEEANAARIEAENAQAALEEAEERYRLLVEHSPAGIFYYQDNHFVYVNPAMANMLGYTPNELIGLHIFNVVAPEEQAWVADRIEKGLYEGHFSVRVLSRQGKRLDLEIGQSDIRMNGGVAVLGTAVDVTERKKTEEALRRSEEKYRELVQNANSIILRWDREGRIGFFNEFAQSFFGYSEDEVLGKGVIGTIVPETETSGRDLIALMEDIRRNPERHESNVNENMRKNGERVWIAWTNKPIMDESGQLKEIFSVGVDITERRLATEALQESEERYKSIFNSNAVAFVLYDLSGRIIDVNPKMCEIHGYPCDELISRFGKQLIAPECHHLFDRFADLKMGEWMEVDSVHIRKDGSMFDVEVYCTKIRYRGKEQLLAVMRDITERNRAREAMSMYADVMQNMQVGLYIYQMEDVSNDRTLKLTAANPKSTSDLGLVEEDLLGKYIDDIFPGLRKHGIVARFAEVVRTGEPFSVDDFFYTDHRLEPRHYSFRAFSVPGNKLGILFEDITSMKRAEEEKKQFYRETISSVTNGKLQIVSSAELERYTEGSDFEEYISSYADTARVRKPIEDYCREKGVSEDRLSLFSIAFGEAMTNAVKHAGEGFVFAGSGEGELWAGVCDRGSGIPALVLPQATLRRGYSTKISMGMGYSIMLEAADKIMLNTGPEGTKVALFLNLQPVEATPSLAAIPDTWDSI